MTSEIILNIIKMYDYIIEVQDSEKRRKKLHKLKPTFYDDFNMLLSSIEIPLNQLQDYMNINRDFQDMCNRYVEINKQRLRKIMLLLSKSEPISPEEYGCLTHQERALVGIIKGHLDSFKAAMYKGWEIDPHDRLSYPYLNKIESQKVEEEQEVEEDTTVGMEAEIDDNEELDESLTVIRLLEDVEPFQNVDGTTLRLLKHDVANIPRCVAQPLIAHKVAQEVRSDYPGNRMT